MGAKKLCLLSVLVLSWSGTGLAQDDELERLEESGSELKEEVDDQCKDPSLSSAARCPEVQIKLSAVRDETRVDLEIGRLASKVGSRQGELRYGVAVGGPIGKKDERADPVSFDGLSDSATAGFSLYWLSSDPVAAFEAAAAERRTSLDPRFNSVDEFVGVSCYCHRDESDRGCEEDRLVELLAAYRDQQVECDSDDLVGSQWDDFVSGTLGIGKRSWVFGLEAKAGSAKFKFSDSEGLEKSEVTRGSSSVSLATGYLPLKSKTYFVGLSVMHQQYYVAKPETEVCQPLGETGALTCANTALGGPDKKEEELARLELRRHFDWGFDGGLTVNPTVTWNFDTDEVGLELPFYFLRDKDGKLNGGLAIAWRSDTDEITASAFLGSMSNWIQKQIKQSDS